MGKRSGDEKEKGREGAEEVASQASSTPVMTEGNPMGMQGERGRNGR